MGAGVYWDQEERQKEPTPVNIARLAPLTVTSLVIIAASLAIPASAQPGQAFSAGMTVQRTAGTSLQERVGQFPDSDAQRYVISEGKRDLEYVPGNRFQDPPADVAEASSCFGAPIVNGIALEILRLTNQARAQRGLLPLGLNDALTEAARGHSEEMLELDYFSHTSPRGWLASPDDRLRAAGAYASRLSENLFEADGFPAEQVARLAVQSWLASPGHRANLLDPQVSQMGLGVVERDGKVSVTQMFGGGVR
jgi:uncharacterized protein YkwD